jgi:hypothetical protein
MNALLIIATTLILSPTGNTQAVCPVTTAPQPQFTTPAPYPVKAPYSSFWYGDERFWTMLGGDGTWAGLPRNERGYRQKVFWWYPGFNGRLEARPDLKVVGRRLDGPESFVSQPATNAHHADFGGWTILSGIDVPTTGCWELTGTYRGQTLTFVVWVAA